MCSGPALFFLLDGEFGLVVELVRLSRDADLLRGRLALGRLRGVVLLVERGGLGGLRCLGRVVLLGRVDWVLF